MILISLSPTVADYPEEHIYKKWELRERNYKRMGIENREYECRKLIRGVFLQDVITGDEIISDSYELKEVDGIVYEADCSMITIGAVTVGTLPRSSRTIPRAFSTIGE